MKTYSIIRKEVKWFPSKFGKEYLVEETDVYFFGIRIYKRKFIDKRLFDMI